MTSGQGVLYYAGTRREAGRNEVVRMHGEQGETCLLVTPLPERWDLVNHSPDGFEWGYRGSGPAQLALALLADATGNDNLAIDMHQAFKDAVLTMICEGAFTITADFIRWWVERYQEE